MNRTNPARISACATIFLTASLLSGQTYDLLLKGGHVIDPSNRIDSVMDVAISGARIARVAADIPAASSRKVIDAAGLYVTPGLIDLHAHVYGYGGSLFPDDTFVRRAKGSELVGLRYEGPFDTLAPGASVDHQIVPWDDVSFEEGTGIVHIATGCGPEDFGNRSNGH